MQDWSPSSWQRQPAAQQPEYPERDAVERVLEELSRRPPLVTIGEIDNLRRQLAEAAAGERFLLQGGDCAESFSDCTPGAIGSKLKILLQMSVVLLHGLRRPIIRVGRIAGQYAKPRTDAMESREGETLPSYRGDLVNRADFTHDARVPDPGRMLEGHDRSAQTLNYIRALLDGGFADLEHPENWDLDFASHSPLEQEYRAIVSGVTESLSLLARVSGGPLHGASRAEFFTSHEALHLLYEQTQVDRDPRSDAWYLTSTHFPWVGMRTGDPDGAHAEFLRGIANPVGIKVGPDTGLDPLLRLLDVLDPDCAPGRLALIHRFGHAHIRERLPQYIEAVSASGHPVLWCCDPMHGNTETTASGVKTRRFEHILGELRDAFNIHAGLSAPLGGVHFELTGDNVTECVGGARGLTESDLARAYESHVDPRLNYEQALEMAMAIVGRRAA